MIIDLKSYSFFQLQKNVDCVFSSFDFAVLLMVSWQNNFTRYEEEQ